MYERPWIKLKAKRVPESNDIVAAADVAQLRLCKLREGEHSVQLAHLVIIVTAQAQVHLLHACRVWECPKGCDGQGDSGAEQDKCCETRVVLEVENTSCARVRVDKEALEFAA